MKRVYIAHPLRGDVEENKRKVMDICKKIEKESQVLPFSPIHAFSFVSAAGCQRKVMSWCTEELSHCDELLVFGSDEEIKKSTGVQAEIAFARAAGIPISYCCLEGINNG